MTLEELADTLPNGFHDAYVDELRLDFIAREAVFELSIWIGDLGSDDEAVREQWRRGRLTLRGLQFCVMEAPKSTSGYAEPKPLWIDQALTPPELQLPQVLPPGAFTSSFFVNQWSAFIHAAALDAALIWLDQ